jgi:uncharacterized membrane protein YdbT with pleckstrin-like domain
MIAFYIRGLIFAVLAGVIAGLVTAIAVGHVQLGWVIGAVLAAFVVLIVVGLLRRIRTTYTVTNQRLTIEVGLLSKDLHHARLGRVQNVNSSQSLVERMLRVGTVDFDTAGEAGYDFCFRGVANPREIVRTIDRALSEPQHESDHALGDPQRPAAPA